VGVDIDAAALTGSLVGEDPEWAEVLLVIPAREVLRASSRARKRF
jgi:hypothetical protein